MSKNKWEDITEWNDTLVIENLISESGKLNNQFPHILERSPSLKEYLATRYDDWDRESFKEVVYRIKNKIDEAPKCIVCGNKLKFLEFRSGYTKRFCGKICKFSDDGKKYWKERIKKSCLEKYGVDCFLKSKEIQEKSKQTCLKKYGVEYVVQSKEFQEKSKQTCLKRYGVENPFGNKEIQEKSKQTCLKRYGVEYGMQSKEIKEMQSQTLIEKYGVAHAMESKKFQEKSKQTCLKRYGVEYPRQSIKVQEKYKETCLKRYGVENSMQSKDIQEQIKKRNLEKYGVEYTTQVKEIQEKKKQTLFKHYKVISPLKNKVIQKRSWDTKKKNGTCNTSKVEDEVHAWLLEKYSDVKRNWDEDPRYPWHADFYIPELDLFIEVQGNWTHGKHAFDKDNEEDKAILESWKEHAKTSKYYTNALKVWIESDVKKRETAKKNNLRYFEYFGNNLKEFQNQFESLLETINI